MRSACVLACGVVLAACSRDDPAPRPSTGVARAGEIAGSLSIDGNAVTSLRCRPGAAVHIFVDVVTPEGVLRFEDAKLSWNGEPLSCTRLDRSWGGGRRPGNEAYWRGTLAFRCQAGARTFTGDLVLDCGDITPAERAQLDQNRQQLRDEQRHDGGS